MTDWLRPFLEITPQGLYSPAFEAYVDPHVPVPRALVTHAHSDHASAGHGEVWATPETLALYRRRNPDWSGRGEAFTFGSGPERAGTVLRLVSAGHVLGSAQLWFESGGESLLYTGDFKLRSSRTAAPAEAPRSKTLVMETTFGLPVFHFPPTAELEARLIAVCRRAFEEGATPILFAYALGKAQEAAAILAEAGIPTVLHGAAWKLVPEFTAAGIALPLSRPYDSGPAEPGEALVVPPSCARTAVVSKRKKRRVVYLSGWAAREASRADFDADVLLPMSDHADFPELLRHVEDVGAQRVLTMHGFAGDFARILAARGVEAEELRELGERAGGEP